MQLFFIALAAISGALLLVTVVYGMITLEAEMRRNRPLKTPEYAAVQKMPPARLTISEYTQSPTLVKSLTIILIGISKKKVTKEEVKRIKIKFPIE